MKLSSKEAHHFLRDLDWTKDLLRLVYCKDYSFYQQEYYFQLRSNSILRIYLLLRRLEGRLHFYLELHLLISAVLSWMHLQCEASWASYPLCLPRSQVSTWPLVVRVSSEVSPTLLVPSWPSFRATHWSVPSWGDGLLRIARWIKRETWWHPWPPTLHPHVLKAILWVFKAAINSVTRSICDANAIKVGDYRGPSAWSLKERRF